MCINLHRAEAPVTFCKKTAKVMEGCSFRSFENTLRAGPTKTSGGIAIMKGPLGRQGGTPQDPWRPPVGPGGVKTMKSDGEYA